MDMMRPCGRLEPGVGDAVVCLQTLVHRGPGELAQGPGRRVLFFSIRPKFVGPRSATDSSVGTYDSDGQIHAAWLLWRTADVCPPAVSAQVREDYRSLGYDLGGYTSDD